MLRVHGRQNFHTKDQLPLNIGNNFIAKSLCVERDTYVCRLKWLNLYLLKPTWGFYEMLSFCALMIQSLFWNVSYGRDMFVGRNWEY